MDTPFRAGNQPAPDVAPKFELKTAMVVVDEARDAEAVHAFCHMEACAIDDLPLGGLGPHSLLRIGRDASASARQLVAQGVDPGIVRFIELPPDSPTVAEMAERDIARLRTLFTNEHRHVYADDVDQIHRIPSPPEMPIILLGADGLGEMFALKKGVFGVIVGGYGSGKSTVSSIIGMRAMASTINDPQPLAMSVTAWEDDIVDFKNRLRAFTTRGQFDAGLTREAIAFEDRVWWFHPQTFDETGLGLWMERVRYLTKYHGVGLHILDPWNSHNPRMEAGERELNYIRRVTSELQALARDLGIIILLVAHTTKSATASAAEFKPFRVLDAAGSGDFGAKAGLGLCVSRSRMFADILHGERQELPAGLDAQIVDEAHRLHLQLPQAIVAAREHVLLFVDKVKVEGAAGRRFARAFVLDKLTNDLVHDPAASVLVDRLWRC